MKLPRFLFAILMVGLFSNSLWGQGAPETISRPDKTVEGWKSAVDPAEVNGKPPMALKLTAPIKHGVRSVAPSRPSSFVAICDDNVFGVKSWSILNLSTGGITPAFADKTKLEEAMLSPDGQFLAGKVGAVGVQPAALVVWTTRPGKEVQRFLSGEKNSAPKAVGFAAGGQILTATDVGFKVHLQAYDLKSGNKNWEIELPKMVEHKNSAISPGGKYLALVLEKSLMLIETGKGETIDKMDLPEAPEKAVFGSHPEGVAFSPDGLELAAYCEHGGKGRLIIWDLATGQVMADHVAEQAKDDRWAKAEAKLEYFGDPHFLRFSNHVLDRETGKVVYTIPQSKKGRNDDLIKAVGQSSVLVISEKEQDKAFISVTMLPKAEIEKSLAVVRTGGKASDANLPPLTKADYSGVRTALDAGAPGAWGLKVDAAAKAPAAAGAIALRAQHSPGGEDQSIKTIAFSGAPANQIAAGYEVNAKGTMKTVIDRIGLAGGIAAGRFEFPEKSELMDLSADGKMLLVKTSEERIDLYSIAAGAAKPVLGLRPYDGDKDGAGIKFAAVLSPEQLLTVSNAGRLVVWNVAGAKAIYEMRTQRDGFALSPSRAQFAFANGKGVTVIDAASGGVLGTLAGPMTVFAGQVVFSADGSRLAYFSSYPYPRLVAYDLSSGKTLADAGLPKEAGNGQVFWTDASHLLVAGCLFDVERKCVIWRYAHDVFMPHLIGAPQSGWAFVRGEGNQPSALLAVALPHAEAKAAEAALKPGENIAVGPGTKVSVQVSITGDAAFQTKVADALKKHVADAGWVVADNADVHLTATTTAKQGRTMQYHVIGGNPASQTVTIPAYDCKLEITQGGQTIWEAATPAGNMAPSFTNLKKGQTVQDLVNEINANPGGGFYESVTFPATIARPLEKVGVSKITLKGVVAGQ